MLGWIASVLVLVCVVAAFAPQLIAGLFKAAVGTLRALPAPVVYFVAAVLAIAGSFYLGEWHGSSTTAAIYEERARRVAERQKDAIDRLTTANSATLKSLREQLDTAKAANKEKQVIIKEVKKYVTAQADANCVIPAGFVWMHERTIAGEGASVPSGGPGDVDASTAVTLSDVAAVEGENNAECTTRGHIIELWQQWYRKASDDYEHAAQQLKEAEEVH